MEWPRNKYVYHSREICYESANFSPIVSNKEVKYILINIKDRYAKKSKNLPTNGQWACLSRTANKSRRVAEYNVTACSA
jgi:hypothetical protein